MINEIKKTFELISLILAIPCVVFAFGVVFVWGKKAVSITVSEKSSAVEWFILGVAVSFLGTVLDNLYWTITWTFHFIDSDLAGSWIEWGPLFNIFFRQACGIIAGVCHIKAASLHGAAGEYLMTPLVRISCIIGVLYALFLIIV